MSDTQANEVILEILENESPMTFDELYAKLRDRAIGGHQARRAVLDLAAEHRIEIDHEMRIALPVAVA